MAEPGSVVAQAHSFDTLGRLVRETAGLRDPALVADRAVRIVAEGCGATAGEIFVVDTNNSTLLRRLSLVAPDAAAFAEYSAFEIGQGYPGLVLQQRSPVVAYDLRTDPRFLARDVVAAGYRRMVVVPLEVQERVFGTLGLFRSDDNSTPFDVATLMLYATQIAAALDAAFVYRHLDSAGLTATDAEVALRVLATQNNNDTLATRLSAVRAITHEVARLRETEQERQRMLYESEYESRKLRTLIDSMPEGFMYADKTGTITEINEIGRAILGAKGDLIGRSAYENQSRLYETSGAAVDSDDWPLSWALTRGVVTRAREMIFRRGDHETALLVSAVPLKNAEGNVEGAVSVFQDISQLKATQRGLEQALQTAETGRRTLRSIVDNIPDGFLYFEADGRIIEINRVARDIMALDALPVPTLAYMRRSFSLHTTTGAPVADADSPLLSALRGETHLAKEFVVRHGDGSEVNIITSTAPIRDTSGAITGAVSILQDVTDLKDAERIKSRFLSMITHELRTPLAAIKGLVSGLLEEDVEWDTETQRSFLESIEAEVDSLTALISNLLDMARLEAGYMRPSLEECSMVDIVQDMGRKLQPLAVRNEQRIDWSTLPPTLPMLVADYNQIERVMVNLVANAIKYAPDNTAIEISGSFDQGGDEIEIRVADRGTGIAAAEQKKIFVPFYRGQQVAGRAGRKVGSGLGLAICHDIVAMHGGRIWYEDRDGGGSLFVVRLPRQAIVN